MHYTEPQIRRILHTGFRTARQRGKRLISVDKMNVLETTQLWRDIAEEIAPEYPDVALSHMLVDNCAMQLVRNPRQFDVIVTGNMFGDILSDEASMLTGSIGMLPSASLDANGKGPVRADPRLGARHRRQGARQSARDDPFDGDDVPLHLRQGRDRRAHRESGSRGARRGLRTADIAAKGIKPSATAEMGTAVAKAL